MARTPGSTAEETRARILAAAGALFADRGYAGTSIRDIAEHVGMTKAALYYHFESKQDVLAALVRPHLEAIDALAASCTAADHVDRAAVLREMLELLAEPDPTLRAVVSDPSALHDVAARLDPRASFRRLARALAGDDPAAMIAVRCALGAVRSGVMATLLDRPAQDGSGLAPADADLIVEAGVRAWSVVEG
jgi:AcrR family transcriptional regulator